MSLPPLKEIRRAGFHCLNIERYASATADTARLLISILHAFSLETFASLYKNKNTVVKCMQKLAKKNKADFWKLMFKVILQSLKGGECYVCLCACL